MTIYNFDARTWDRVLEDVSRERERQDDKWGEQSHADRMPSEYPYGDTPDYVKTAQHWKDLNDVRVAWMNEQGKTSDCNAAWDGILLEEVYEALAETEPDKVRAELVQVAAVAVNWIEAIDRRSA